MFIGERLKALRKARHMTLSEVAELSKVQLATLSRIENKKMVGTLESHINIAKALSIDVTELYKGLGKEGAAVEVGKQDKTDMFTHSERSSFEILTKNIMHKKMMPVLIRIEKDGKTNKEQNRPGSEKFIFVLEGRAEITIDNKTYPLSKSNTLYFDAALPHFVRNVGKSAVKIISVITPVSL